MMKWTLLLTAFLALASCAQKDTVPTSSPTASEKASDSKPAKESPKPADKKDSVIAPRGIDFGATIEDVAFSCCADQDAPQSIWKTVAARDPDLFLFTGNTVYLKPDEKSLGAQYKKLQHISEYRTVREKVPFLVTWDDRDYDDGNETSKKEFLHQWTYIQDSLALGQGGIYHAKIIGPKKKQVQIIVLDTRSFRSPLVKAEKFNPEAPQYLPNTDPNATILGAEQWEWLDEQLRRPAQVRIVVTSIPLVATQAPIEKWGNFPLERQRFFELLKKTQTRDLVVVSGHHGIGAIAKADIKNWGTLFDVMAGPLNMPTHDSETDPSYLDKGIGAANFGMIHIDWKKRTVKLEVRDEGNKVTSSSTLNLR